MNSEVPKCIYYDEGFCKNKGQCINKHPTINCNSECCTNKKNGLLKKNLKNYFDPPSQFLFTLFKKSFCMDRKEKKLYWCYYPHWSKDPVSPVCGIFFYKVLELVMDGLLSTGLPRLVILVSWYLYWFHGIYIGASAFLEVPWYLCCCHGIYIGAWFLYWCHNVYIGAIAMVFIMVQWLLYWCHGIVNIAMEVILLPWYLC